MIEYFSDLLKYDFLKLALLTGLLASVSCGIVGTYVVSRRITYIAGGIAHSVLGGMGAALYLQKVHNVSFLHPLWGATFAGLLSAIIIGMVSLKARQREDTVIGAIWAIGMAVGILFISVTPGYNQDLMSYLFGNILIVSHQDIWMIAGLDFLVVVLGLVFYKQFLAICFDVEFAQVRGINVSFYYLLLLCLTALTVVLLVTVVGIVMVIALLTLPVALAGNFTKTLLQMMALSIFFSMVFTTTGLALSYGLDFPAGATIILLSGGAYLGVIVLKTIFGSLIKTKN